MGRFGFDIIRIRKYLHLFQGFKAKKCPICVGVYSHLALALADTF